MLATSQMSHRRRGPTYRTAGTPLVMMALIFLLSACGGDQAGETPQESTDVETRPDITPSCVELDYPCDWRDADREVLIDTLKLLDEVADALATGESVEDVAARLQSTAGVVSVNWAEEGIIFRRDGGLPVTAFTESASPVYTSSDATEPETSAAAFSPDAIRASLPNEAASPAILAQSATESSYEPARAPDIRPRQVMVLSPTRSADLAAAVAASSGAGVLPPSAPPSQTRDTFSASEDFEVLDLPDEQAHPGHWANMGAFDAVVIETHGAYYECRDDGSVCGLFLAGPLAGPYLEALGLTEEDVASEFEPGATDPQVAYQDFGGFTFARLSIDGRIHISFDDDFFHQLPGSGVGRNIVIVNACKMGEEQVSTTALASNIAGSRGAVFSWDRGIPRVSSDAVTATLAELLIEGADPDAAMEQMRQDGLNTALYRGIEARLLLYREPGVSLRARDVVVTHVDGVVAEPGATISAKGRPEDGQNDRIGGVEIRIDGVNWNDRDSTTVEIKVDGQPIKVVQDGNETTSPALSDRTERGSTSGSWERHVIDLDNAILPFDLTREDVTQGRGHVWEVIVQGSTGGPSIHKIEPVIFRLGSVRILNPNNTAPLEPNDQVFIEGEAGDGESETYQLIVRVEHLDESADSAAYKVEVSFDGNDEVLALTEFESLGDGAYRYTREVDLGDLQMRENPVPVSAKLTLASDGEVEMVDEVDATPIVLVLEESGPGEATIIVGGSAWEFELTELLGASCRLDESSLLVSGAVDGDQEGVTFSADVRSDGSGYLDVNDYPNDQFWMAAADRENMTVLHLVPDGQSQIDSISFDGRVVSGEATFIDARAFEDAWLTNGAYPAPVTGSFEIRCPAP